MAMNPDQLDTLRKQARLEGMHVAVREDGNVRQQRAVIQQADNWYFRNVLLPEHGKRGLVTVNPLRTGLCLSDFIRRPGAMAVMRSRVLDPLRDLRAKLPTWPHAQMSYVAHFVIACHACEHEHEFRSLAVVLHCVRWQGRPRVVIHVALEVGDVDATPPTLGEAMADVCQENWTSENATECWRSVCQHWAAWLLDVHTWPGVLYLATWFQRRYFSALFSVDAESDLAGLFPENIERMVRVRVPPPTDEPPKGAWVGPGFPGA